MSSSGTLMTPTYAPPVSVTPPPTAGATPIRSRYVVSSDPSASSRSWTGGSVDLYCRTLTAGIGYPSGVETVGTASPGPSSASSGGTDLSAARTLARLKRSPAPASLKKYSAERRLDAPLPDPRQQALVEVLAHEVAEADREVAGSRPSR